MIQERKNDMASIIKRKKNYSVVYNYVDENGETKQKWETWHTHKEALKRKAEIENQQHTGTFLPPSNQTITEFLYDFVSLYSKKFREEHEEEILLHQAAKNAFDEMGVKKLPKVKELQTEYAKLLEEKKKTYAEYRRSREEMRELLTAKANVDRVLKMEVEQDVEKEKDHGQR